jgi:hypothetical protein
MPGSNKRRSRTAVPTVKSDGVVPQIFRHSHRALFSPVRGVACCVKARDSGRVAWVSLRGNNAMFSGLRDSDEVGTWLAARWTIVGAPTMISPSMDAGEAAALAGAVTAVATLAGGLGGAWLNTRGDTTSWRRERRQMAYGNATLALTRIRLRRRRMALQQETLVAKDELPAFLGELAEVQSAFLMLLTVCGKRHRELLGERSQQLDLLVENMLVKPDDLRARGIPVMSPEAVSAGLEEVSDAVRAASLTDLKD